MKLRTISARRAPHLGVLIVALIVAAVGAMSVGTVSSKPVSSILPVNKLGKVTTGASNAVWSPDDKRVNRWNLPTDGWVNKMEVEIKMSGGTSPGSLQGVIYSDANGVPGSLLAATVPLTIVNTQPSGWYDLSITNPVHLPAGNYWLGTISTGYVGFYFDNVPGSRYWNNNPFATGPSSTFGPLVGHDGAQMSINAWYWNSAPPAGSATFGKTTVGGNAASWATDMKRVNKWMLPNAGSVSKLDVYLQPVAGTTGQESIEGLIYADAGGVPGSLLAVSQPAYFSSFSASWWYDLTFASPVNLPPGTYWIGTITGGATNVAQYRYDFGYPTRYVNANAYASGPTNPFGSGYPDSVQTSLFATYTGGVTSTPTPPPPPLPVTSLYFSSQPGDYIGQGHTAYFVQPGNATFNSHAEFGGYANPPSTGGITVSIFAAGGENWTVTVAPPNGQALHPGNYSYATRAPFQSGGAAGLDVSGDGRGCNNSFDSFTVNQLTINPAGIVTALDVSFVQHCESPSAPPLSGRIEVNATQ